MSLWTCDKCGWQGRTTQQSGHKAFRCPEQGNLKKNLEKQAKPHKPWQVLKCLCGCGADIEQIKGQKKKHFVDTDHYESHRAQIRAKQRREEEEREAKYGPVVEDDSAAERKLTEELAPIALRDAEIQLAAERVPMVTGEASFRLWAACLGFSVDATPVAA